MERLPIILNPNAGRGAARETDALRAAFGAVGIAAEVHVVDGPGIPNVVRSLAQGGARAVGVAGGDGTISSAANQLCGSNTALLPVPLGTHNHFAQRFGVPTVEAAAHAAQRSHEHDIPVGFLNDRAFINNASCGFYPHVVRSREAMERALVPRPIAFWLAGLIMLARMPLMTLDLDLDTQRRRLLTPALWVGLGRNSLRLPQPGDAEREGEVLEIVTPTTRRRTATVALMMRTMVKLKRAAQTPQDQALEVFHAPSFTLDSPHRIDVGLDGEPLRLAPPLRFRFAPRGLKVLCLVAP